MYLIVGIFICLYIYIKLSYIFMSNTTHQEHNNKVSSDYKKSVSGHNS